MYVRDYVYYLVHSTIIALCYTGVARLYKSSVYGSREWV